MILNFTEENLYCQENDAGNIPLAAGITLTLACTFWGDVSSVSAKVFELDPNTSTEVTSTAMPSGSVTIVDATATLKPMTALVGGYTHIVEVTGTVGGDVHVKRAKFDVREAGTP